MHLTPLESPHSRDEWWLVDGAELAREGAWVWATGLRPERAEQLAREHNAAAAIESILVAAASCLLDVSVHTLRGHPDPAADWEAIHDAAGEAWQGIERLQRQLGVHWSQSPVAVLGGCG